MADFSQLFWNCSEKTRLYWKLSLFEAAILMLFEWVDGKVLKCQEVGTHILFLILSFLCPALSCPTTYFQIGFQRWASWIYFCQLGRHEFAVISWRPKNWFVSFLDRFDHWCLRLWRSHFASFFDFCGCQTSWAPEHSLYHHQELCYFEGPFSSTSWFLSVVLHLLGNFCILSAHQQNYIHFCGFDTHALAPLIFQNVNSFADRLFPYKN